MTIAMFDLFVVMNLVMTPQEYFNTWGFTSNEDD
jgi:hypothetical protein